MVERVFLCILAAVTLLEICLLPMRVVQLKAFTRRSCMSSTSFVRMAPTMPFCRTLLNAFFALVFDLRLALGKRRLSIMASCAICMPKCYLPDSFSYDVEIWSVGCGGMGFL